VIFYYLDASAWVKRYCQEIGSSWVEDFFDHQQIIACASLGYVEVMATLSRKKKAQEMAAPAFEEKLQELGADWERFFQVKMADEVVELAADLARDLALRGADAVHLAAALWLQKLLSAEEDQLIFVTTDRELKKGAQSSGLEVVDPEEQEASAPTRDEEKERDSQLEA